MPSSPLDGKHGRTMSGVACHHCHWVAQTIGGCQALHAIIAFGQHTQSNDVGRGMPSSPLGSTNGRTTSRVDCQQHLWAAYTVKRRRAWHAIIALGQHTRSNDVRHDLPSSPLDSTHDRMTLGMACHHHLWAAQTVGWRRPWHAIVALGRQTRSNKVCRRMPS